MKGLVSDAKLRFELFPPYRTRNTRTAYADSAKTSTRRFPSSRARGASILELGRSLRLRLSLPLNPRDYVHYAPPNTATKPEVLAHVSTSGGSRAVSAGVAGDRCC